MSYNVFITHPQTGCTIASVHADEPYHASVAVNMWLDLGFGVDSDLWEDYDPTAMIWPGVKFTTIPRTMSADPAPKLDGYGSNYRPWETRPMTSIRLDQV